MNITVPLVFILTASVLIHQGTAADRLSGTLRHLRRHVPGRASPPQAAPILESTGVKPSCELFIALPSGSVERRAVIRETWGREVRAHKDLIMLFYLHENLKGAGEDITEVNEEQAQYNDLVIIRDEDFGFELATGQAGVTQRVYLMMQHAQANYNMTLFMKSDDDTFINVPILLNALRKRVTDRFVYIGFKLNKVKEWWDVEQELGQLWLDDLGEKEKTWEPSMDSTYMQGGAYILSKEAVDAIVAVNHATGLRFLYNEDLTVGLWVSAMHLKYLTGDDIGITIHPWGYEDDFVQVAAHYCQEFVHPLGWVHNLKSTHDMMEVFHLAQSCTDVKPAVR